MDEVGGRLQREMEVESERWRRETEEADGRTGRVRPPWFWDEPAERLEWVLEGDSEDEEGEEDMEYEDEEEEDAEGEEEEG